MDNYSIEKYSLVTIYNVAPELLVLQCSETKLVIPIIITEELSINIGFRFLKKTPYRPTTYDLFDQVLAKLDAKVSTVFIDKIVEGIFIGRILVSADDVESFEFDSKVSDAVALALGNGAPIYMAKNLIKMFGTSIHSIHTYIEMFGTIF